MPRNTYHSKRCIDYDSLYHLAYYGETRRICDTIRGVAPDKVSDVLNTRGGISSLSDAEEGGFSYLLRLEKGKWQLRSVQGITAAKYFNFAVLPLHFACASRASVDTIVLLLQHGARDGDANIYCSTSLRAAEMVANDEHLRAVFAFWSSSAQTWDPNAHSLFPEQFRHVVRALVMANARSRNRLCDDLVHEVASFVPSSVLLLSEWWS